MVAMNAFRDWKLMSDRYDFTLANFGLLLCNSLVLCNSKSSIHRHCIEAGIGLPTGRLHFILV